MLLRLLLVVFFLATIYNIIYPLTDRNLFWSNVVQDWSYTLFAVVLHLNFKRYFVKTCPIIDNYYKARACKDITRALIV